MTLWGGLSGSEWHKAAHSGRPFLAFGTPRYGHDAPRLAICHFETGKGYMESNNGAAFTPIYWQPLPEPPNA